MAFALQPELELSQEIARILLEQLDNAVHHLAMQEADPADAVHEARKAMKRARTTLRLLRRALGKPGFGRENDCLRQAGQMLSPARDVHMMVEVTKRLGKQMSGSPYAEAVAPVQQAFKDRAANYPLPEELLQKIVAMLQSARQRIEDRLLDLSPKSMIRSIDRGMARMMRRGQRAYARAMSEPSDENFHEWRKRVKDLYYTACLLHLTRPIKLAPIVDLLDRMAHELGDEHDLGLLATRIHDDPQAAGGPVPVALLLQLIARRREELRVGLRPLGQELYQRSPKRMSRFLGKGLGS